ncbi:hypothetical protein EJ08DRAFT_695676 [Tothia fuscella]|uniref:75k gamma secalin n=1 Tax=Tothia fuscella TaxID=1048955 RepID=A0A9P4NVM6_9PEZI|nr:hypothetical protein EJ08DRAFT_695676 [Tothia fuscella]
MNNNNNYNYVNYQTPSNTGYANPNGSPIQYGYNPQTEIQPQNAYTVPAQQQRHPQVVNGQQQQYGAYAPTAYSNQNQYQHQPPPPPQQSPSNQNYSHPMVVIPRQRVNSSSIYSPQNSNFQSPAPSSLSQSTTYYTPPQLPPQSLSQPQPQPQSQQRQPSHTSSQHQWQGQLPPQQIRQQQQQQPVNYQPYLTYPSHTSPTMPQRVVKTQAMVEIPASRPQHQAPQRYHSSQSHASRTSSNGSLKKQAPPQPLPLEPQVDYQQLLLALAEEYIEAAYAMGPLVALYRREEEMDQYRQLMATGLACMEAVLKKFRLKPREEGELSLQYASLMFAETESWSHMEGVLSKGITHCERNKLLDLKYSMQHLFVQVVFKTSAKVALKSLDQLIRDVEAYKHTPWIYAFRFLRVTLSLQLTDSTHDISVALQNLRAISALAEGRHKAVYITCATLEAMVHLRSPSADSLEQLQRAIASARTYQLDPSVEHMVQIWTLLDYIDVSCSLMQCLPDQSYTKNNAMQKMMDTVIESPLWNDDGTICVSLNMQATSLTESTNGIFRRSKDGKDSIVFSWLNKRDLYTLGFFMSAVTATLRNTIDDKIEIYITEGLKTLRENFDPANLTLSDVVPQTSSLGVASEHLSWWTKLEWNLHLFLAFWRCNRLEWDIARTHLKALDKEGEGNEQTSRQQWLTYLRGIIEQGSGNLDQALFYFQDPSLALLESLPSRTSDARSDLKLLAALNTLLIIHPHNHPSHYISGPTLTALEPLTIDHPNKSISSAMHLVKSILNPDDFITSRKQSLQTALNCARAVNNSQLLAVSMSVMTDMFFKGVVGDQAQKSTKTARVLAQRAGNGLWGAVAGGMMADTLEDLGSGEQAERVRGEVYAAVEKLPEGVRNTLLRE